MLYIFRKNSLIIFWMLHVLCCYLYRLYSVHDVQIIEIVWCIGTVYSYKYRLYNVDNS